MQRVIYNKIIGISVYKSLVMNLLQDKMLIGIYPTAEKTTAANADSFLNQWGGPDRDVGVQMEFCLSVFVLFLFWRELLQKGSKST